MKKITLIFVLLFHCQVYAQISSEQRLADIQSAVVRETEGLRKLQDDVQQLKKKHTAIEAEATKLKTQLTELENSLSNLQFERENTRQSIIEIEQKMLKIEGASMTRIRALYMERSMPFLEKLLVADTSLTMVRNAYFLGKIKDFDQALLSEYRLLKQEKIKKEAQLKKLYEQQEKFKADIAKKQLAKSAALAHQKKLLSSLQQKKGKVETSLIALKAQALRLETVISSLTGAETIPLEAPLSEQKNHPTTSIEKTSPMKPVSAAMGFIGQGLLALKGKLTQPTTGEILKKYGKVQHQSFEDFVFHKGLEYQVPAPYEIKAIAPGRVLHLGKMAGYGKIMIIDHGKRTYSLYGRIETILVQSGQTVEAGQLVAKVAKSKGGQSNFYFEIREKGVPTNPQKFFGH